MESVLSQHPVPPASIFKAYDIRGIVDETLTEHGVEQVGQALGLQIRRAHEASRSSAKPWPLACVVGRDGRHSGPRLQAALSRGLSAQGIRVIDIGRVPTPVVYYAVHQLGIGSGVAITGSHNPPAYNGLKMMVGGETLHGAAIAALRSAILDGSALPAAGLPAGALESKDMAEDYLQRIVGDVKLSRPLRIAVDAGNGVAGELGPELLRRLGCEVTPLFCDIDGDFPNHHPDPAHPENLQDLIRAVQAGGLDLGLAFDGDGDRLGVVTPSGEIIWPDRQLMLYAEDVLARNPGAEILYDVKCTGLLADWIRSRGGVPSLCRTGHSLVKARLKETGAPLAGEMSGHVFFKERWFGFDDGLYTAARLLEIVSRSPNPAGVLEALPTAVSTPEMQIPTAEGEHHALMARFVQEARFPGEVSRFTLDGIRVEYAHGFGLARPSNTTPVVVLRFESQTAEGLAEIQGEFRRAFASLAPHLALPF